MPNWTSTPRWFDSDELRGFAWALVAGGYFHGDNALNDLLYYFEKPWKWEGEYKFWAKQGRPTRFDVDAYNRANPDSPDHGP